MIDLPTLIYTLYKQELAEGKIVLQDDGMGPYIKEWSLDAQKPTQNQIDSWMQDPAILAANSFALVVNKLDTYINQVARDRQYNSADSLCSYIGCPNTQWNQEAIVFQAWRTQVWEYAFEIKTRVDQGQIPLPTIEEFFASLPVIQWP
jgi:hypothetical protein